MKKFFKFMLIMLGLSGSALLANADDFDYVEEAHEEMAALGLPMDTAVHTHALKQAIIAQEENIPAEQKSTPQQIEQKVAVTHKMHQAIQEAEIARQEAAAKQHEAVVAAAVSDAKQNWLARMWSNYLRPRAIYDRSATGLGQAWRGIRATPGYVGSGLKSGAAATGRGIRRVTYDPAAWTLGKTVDASKAVGQRIADIPGVRATGRGIKYVTYDPAAWGVRKTVGAGRAIGSGIKTGAVATGKGIKRVTYDPAAWGVGKTVGAGRTIGGGIKTGAQKTMAAPGALYSSLRGSAAPEVEEEEIEIVTES